MSFRIQVNMPTIPVLHNPANTQVGANLIQALNQRNEDRIDQILSSPGILQISSADLGTALMLSFEYFRDSYYDKILTLPAAQNILANGSGGIGHSLAVVCRIQEPDGFNSIIQHPNFININANGPFGLSEAMAAYLKTFMGERKLPDDPNPEYLKAIINHPNADQINFTQQLSDLIGESLLYIAAQSEEVFRDEDEEILNLLLNIKISHLISPNGQFGLGRIMANAAYSTTPSIVTSILAHPAALRINSGKTVTIKGTDAEEAWSLDNFGFESALFLAVNNGDPKVQNPKNYQNQIVQALINFTNMNGIVLSPNTPFGIADSLTEAASLDDGLTLCILSSNSSVHIQPQAPNEDSGGLNNALINAVHNGLLQTVQALLQHPNASQIPLSDLKQGVMIATNSNQQIAQEIRNYALRIHGVTL